MSTPKRTVQSTQSGRSTHANPRFHAASPHVGRRLAWWMAMAPLGLVGCGEEPTSEGDLAALQEQLDDLGEEVDQQQVTIATLEAQLAVATGGSDLSELEDLTERLAELEGLPDRVTDLEDDLDDALALTDLEGLETRVTTLEGEVVGGLSTYLSVDPSSNSVTFSGANVHVQSGSGATDDGGSLTGLGNLVIGYNADTAADGSDAHTGSHNLVLGDENTYTNFGGLVSGYNNEISGIYSVAVGGYENVANGRWSGLFGGATNESSGDFSAIVGSHRSLANGDISTISGGRYNTASGYLSSVSGGEYNTASGELATVAGGLNETSSTKWGYTAP